MFSPDMLPYLFLVIRAVLDLKQLAGNCIRFSGIYFFYAFMYELGINCDIAVNEENIGFGGILHACISCCRGFYITRNLNNPKVVYFAGIAFHDLKRIVR